VHLLSWRANGDGFDVALAFNRLLAAGAEAWWLTTAEAPADPGDYLVDASPELVRAVAALGVTLSP
jgi:hypothetical protein